MFSFRNTILKPNQTYIFIFARKLDIEKKVFVNLENSSNVTITSLEIFYSTDGKRFMQSGTSGSMLV